MRTGRAAGLTFIGLAVHGGARVLTNVIIGRSGGPVVLGVVGAAISLSLLLTLLGPNSIASALTKFMSARRGAGDCKGAAFVQRFLSRIAFMLVGLLAVAGAGIEWWRTSSVVNAAIVALLVAGYAVYAVVRGILYGQGQVRRAVFGDVASAVLGLVGLSVLVACGVRGVVLVVPVGLALLAYGSLIRPGAKAQLVARVPADQAASLRKEMDLFVFFGVAATLASTGLIQASVLVAQAVAGTAGAGIYYAAQTLATPASIVSSALGLAVFPLLSAAFGRADMDDYRFQTDKWLRITSGIFLVLFGNLILAGHILIHFIWGDRFSQSVPVLGVLLGAVMVSAIGSVPTVALTSRGQRGVMASTAISITGLVAGALTWALVSTRLGALGVAIGYVVGTCVVAFGGIITTWHHDHHRWWSLLVRWLAGLIALGLAYWAVGAFGGGIALTAVCMVAFTAACVVTRADLWRYLPRGFPRAPRRTKRAAGPRRRHARHGRA